MMMLIMMRTMTIFMMMVIIIYLLFTGRVSQLFYILISVPFGIIYGGEIIETACLDLKTLQNFNHPTLYIMRYSPFNPGGGVVIERWTWVLLPSLDIFVSEAY